MCTSVKSQIYISIISNRLTLDFNKKFFTFKEVLRPQYIDDDLNFVSNFTFITKQNVYPKKELICEIKTTPKNNKFSG